MVHSSCRKLKNDDHGKLLSQMSHNFLDNENSVDVTLVSSDGMSVMAHQVILASFSEFFYQLFTDYPHPEPLVHLTGVKHTDLRNLLQYMYSGQCKIQLEDMENFLILATELKIFVLSKDTSDVKDSGQNSIGIGVVTSSSKPSPKDNKNLLDPIEKNICIEQNIAIKL